MQAAKTNLQVLIEGNNRSIAASRKALDHVAEGNVAAAHSVDYSLAELKKSMEWLRSLPTTDVTPAG